VTSTDQSSDACYREIEVELAAADTLPFVQVLDEGLVLTELSGYYEVLYDEARPRVDSSDPDDHRSRLMLYFPIHAELAAAQVELVLTALDLRNFRISEKRIERQDYLEAYKQYYTPFAISRRLVIVPSWDRGTERETEARASLVGAPISLYLDPGLAFGTGKHPTTELCLQYLDDLFGDPARAPRDLIDAGAGSGILALGALLLGARSVFAFDVDGNAATACAQNRQLNPAIKGDLIFEQGGFDLPALRGRKADLLLGNLTAAVLLANRAFIEGMAVERMVLSGILSEQQNEVIQAFTSGGSANAGAAGSDSSPGQPRFRFTEARENDGWVLLEFHSI
jgi:ribosomal protein L11 methyltransferase